MYSEKTGTDINVSAIILAAGKGSRMNSEENKMFIKLGGVPVIIRTLQVFEHCSLVNEITIVVSQDEHETFKKLISEFGLKKVVKCVDGGKSRQQSVYNGLMVVDKQTHIVLIHDGARPFVQCSNIKDTIITALEYGAAITAVPVKDTIKTYDSLGYVSQTFDRKTLISVQTPQAFKYNLILDAHRQANKEAFTGTDDATLVERLGYKVKAVTGSYENIKITTPNDVWVAEALVSRGKNDL